MIPFDVDPSVYIPFIVCITASIVFIIFACNKFLRNISLLASLAFAILSIVALLFFVASGSVYIDTITICTHTEGNYMKVVDTNQNLYYVVDDLTQFKVKDGETVKAKILNKMGSKYIYSIDAPIACGNQTCGVAT